MDRTLAKIDTADGKQKVITALYEKFFKNAFPKDQAINGVVYTPIEIVDFIIHSAAEVLKQEFGRDINDEGVNIIDPFTGTGTFIARLMESGLITKENLERKYKHELFANEITLLAYYIAAVNIENTYSRLTDSETYVPFENILLTDTFNIEELCRRGGTASQTDLKIEDAYFYKNRAIIRKENNAPITLIIGNPPYGANQKSGNDDAKKRRYQNGIDSRISTTYLDPSLLSSHKMPSSVYDNYIRAFRWATDRLRGGEGIIAFVSPSGWLIGSAFEGFRKCIERDFSDIYVFNLRGDGAGTYKLEGDNVFVLGTNRGCKTGIAITLLVKRRDNNRGSKVYYCDIMEMGQGYHVLEKRSTIADCHSFPTMIANGKMSLLHPKDNGDWIVQRSAIFPTLLPLAGDTHRKFEQHCEQTIFTGYSRGNGTSRDAWMYNFSKDQLCDNMEGFIQEYNIQTKNGKIEYIPNRIKWSYWLEERAKKHQMMEYDDSAAVISKYRPFTKMFYYQNDKICNSPANMPCIYPDGAENLTICVAGVGVKKDFSCLITNTHTDLEIVGKSQCFPLYWYEIDPERGSKQRSIADFGASIQSNGMTRHDGISDWALDQAKSKYGSDMTKEDLFYYVYGYLHSADYRTAFNDDLKLSLPRIGLVDNPEDFHRFIEAGRKLATSI